MFWTKPLATQAEIDRIASHKTLRKYRRLGDDLMRQLKELADDHPRRPFTPTEVLYEMANDPKVESFYNDLLDCLNKHKVSISDWSGVYLTFNDRDQVVNLQELGYAVNPY